MSEKPAFTPGPWAVRRSKMATDGAFDYAISADGAPVIAEAFGRDAKGGWPSSEANARLIAAAPEMFETLVAVRARFQHLRLGPDEAGVLDRVDAALSKALGKDAP